MKGDEDLATEVHMPMHLHMHMHMHMHLHMLLCDPVPTSSPPSPATRRWTT